MDDKAVIIIFVTAAILFVGWQIMQPKEGPAPSQPGGNQAEDLSPTEASVAEKPVICTETGLPYSADLITSFKKPMKLRIESRANSEYTEDALVIFNENGVLSYTEGDGWISWLSSPVDVSSDFDKPPEILEESLRQAQMEIIGDLGGYSISCEYVEDIPDSQFQAPAGETVLTYEERLQKLAQDEADDIRAEIESFMASEATESEIMLKTSLEAFNSWMPYTVQISPNQVEVGVVEYDYPGLSNMMVGSIPEPSSTRYSKGVSAISIGEFQLEEGYSVSCSDEEISQGALIYLTRETSYEYDDLADALFVIITLTIDASEGCGDLIVLESRIEEEL